MNHSGSNFVRFLSAVWLATACCMAHSQAAAADQAQQASPALKQFEELDQWFASSRALIAAGKMKPSDMYRGAYDRVTRFDDAPEKFLFLRSLSSMLDAALAWEHKKYTKDEFDSAIRNADITYGEALANLKRERQEQQAREKAAQDQAEATQRLTAIREQEARDADFQRQSAELQSRQQAYEAWRRAQMLDAFRTGLQRGLDRTRAQQPPAPSYTDCTSSNGIGGTVQTNCTQYQLQH